MELDPQLLEILVCPQCKGPLQVRQEEEGLACPACKLLYPVKDHIPVMLAEEAKSLEG